MERYGSDEVLYDGRRHMPRLRRMDCSGPGITRRRRGRGWQYLDEDATPITEPEVLARINELVIPPAWKDVWICPYPLGHLQAVGTDDAGRKQYLYHPVWRKRRDLEKFDSMLEFARRLPQIRSTCDEHLSLEGYPREQVLACSIRLLDRGFFRVGSESYAELNETYGLATLQKRHVHIKGDAMSFDYVAKGGKRRVQSVWDPEVALIVAGLKKRRSGTSELLAYKLGGKWVDVRSSDINEYLKDISGGDFSAKAFRTWNGTVLAAIGLAVSAQSATSKTARKRAKSRAVQEVASYLGNTPAVARSSYIDPRVLDCFDAGWTISGALEQLGEIEEPGQPMLQGSVEEAVLDLLEGNRSSDSIQKVA